MSLLKPAYLSIFVTVVVLGLALIAGNMAGGVQAAPIRAPIAAPEQQSAGTIGEVTGTALPGDIVRLTQGEVLIGGAVADAGGNWRVPIPASASKSAPFHVQIVPAPRRGAVEPNPESPISILVSVVVGTTKVEVRVQVISPNGQIDIDVSAPIEPVCDCESQGAQVAPQPVAEPTAGPVYHQVRSGETLAIIAGRYGVTTKAIMDANKLRNPNLIFVGQRLVIPK